MPNYTNLLRDPDDALSMCRRYAIDPASNPDGYKPIFTRELPTKGDHGDFGGFRQTTLARKQRISNVHLDKKMEHKLDGVSLCELLEGKESEFPERDWFSYHGQNGAENETIAIKTANWKMVVNVCSTEESWDLFRCEIAVAGKTPTWARG